MNAGRIASRYSVWPLYEPNFHEFKIFGILRFDPIQRRLSIDVHWKFHQTSWIRSLCILPPSKTWLLFYLSSPSTCIWPHLGTLKHAHVWEKMCVWRQHLLSTLKSVPSTFAQTVKANATIHALYNARGKENYYCKLRNIFHFTYFMWNLVYAFFPQITHSLPSPPSPYTHTQSPSRVYFGYFWKWKNKHRHTLKGNKTAGYKWNIEVMLGASTCVYIVLYNISLLHTNNNSSSSIPAPAFFCSLTNNNLGAHTYFLTTIFHPYI